MTISSLSNNKMADAMLKLSTMKKINKAADDASGMAIAEKMRSQSNGYDAGTRNAADGYNMLSVAEGGLDSVQSSLQRMKELSIQASNGIYSDEDRAMMQEEINGLKSSIQDAAKGTEFNTMKLLDGSRSDVNLATSPDGSGKKVNLANSTLDALGIADYDVTKSFHVEDIDKAINMVSKSRGKIGADQNTLEHTMNYNKVASQNLTAARSNIEDADVGKAVSDYQKEKILGDYQRFAMMAKMKETGLDINRILGI